MKQIFKYSLLYLLLSFAGCKEKYEPSIITTDLRYLVVDGSLISGGDSTIIRLSRTKTLDLNPDIGGEQNAQMTVEDTEGNTLYNFVQINNNGGYAVNGMNLDVNKKYKLRINTNDGNQYLSDEITVKNTPAIDSISWRRNPDGVTIYDNTHDPQNATMYYRWEYIETWDYTTNYLSLLKYQASDTTVVARKPDEFVNHCWKTVHSNQILLGSSVQLSADVISEMPLRFIPVNSVELSSEYSILVKQYAVTKDAFEYFENIKKISEQAGSLFDAQPSQLGSNMHCINNSSQQVIGYISASSLQQARIFIKKEQVEPWYYLVECPQPKLLSPVPESLEFFLGGKHPFFVPIEEIPFSGIRISIPKCTDCTSQGGVNVKPDYWP